MNRRPVKLRIRELVLSGVDPNDAPRVGTALERELARLLAEQGLPAGLEAAGHRGRLDGGELSTDPNSTPEGTGVQIARAVYKGIQT